MQQTHNYTTKDYFNVMIITNDLGQKEALEKLSRECPQGRSDTVVGVGGFFTLNIAAERRAVQFIEIFDISDKVEKFWLNTVPLILKSETKEAFKNCFLNHVKENQDYYFSRPARNDLESYVRWTHALQMDHLENEEQEGLSWLSSAEKYNKIRKIFQSDHFRFTRLDICDTQSFEKYLASLKAQGQSIDTISLSNIGDCLTNESQCQQYLHSIAVIPPNCAMIDATKKVKDGRLEVSSTGTLRVSYPPSANPTPSMFNNWVLDYTQRNQVGDLRRILNDKADPNSRTSLGDTALSLASKAGDVPSAKLLLEMQADPNTQNISGDSPLILAAQLPEVTLARMLLDAKADVTHENMRQQDAFQVALENQNIPIIDLLTEYQPVLSENS